ncbi:hypothetical protein TNCV_910161 [Trichonephila clavipes]|uniref:Uncharacterized protein n=1 Tax=Trichonephila clavipes TaxID=2585209 RepID=A0A8X6W3U5_TRICX|nr:hypothetical protein TNCV_910161 [Trichonephila clavipes]
MSDNLGNDEQIPSEEEFQPTLRKTNEPVVTAKFQNGTWKCKDGSTNFHGEECSGRSSVITDDLMPAVETKIR